MPDLAEGRFFPPAIHSDDSQSLHCGFGHLQLGAGLSLTFSWHETDEKGLLNKPAQGWSKVLSTVCMLRTGVPDQ